MPDTVMLAWVQLDMSLTSSSVHIRYTTAIKLHLFNHNTIATLQASSCVLACADCDCTSDNNHSVAQGTFQQLGMAHVHDVPLWHGGRH